MDESGQKEVESARAVSEDEYVHTTSPQRSEERQTPHTKTAGAPPKLGVWGALAAARLASKKPNQRDNDDAASKRTLKSVAKRVNRQIKAMSLIKKWTQMTSLGQFAKDENHLNYIRDVTKQTSIEIPAPLEACIREESLGILQETLKQYRVELGTNHPLTQEMQAKIQEMKEQVLACVPKEGRRDLTFFKKFSNVFLGNE